MEAIKNNIKEIYATLEPTGDADEIMMFDLISAYNKKHENKELIGGKWVRENIPELKDLP